MSFNPWQTLIARITAKTVCSVRTAAGSVLRFNTRSCMRGSSTWEREVMPSRTGPPESSAGHNAAGRGTRPFALNERIISIGVGPMARLDSRPGFWL